MNRCGSLSVVLTAILAVSTPSPAGVGNIDLGPEEFVRANGTDIVVPGYSVPCFEDWNNDGLKDLIVGEGGSSAGKVRVYLNRGSAANPSFADSFYVQADGWDLNVPPQGCLGAFPRVVYWDEDDRKDLLVGCADGTVAIYLNIADDNEPVFGAAQTVNFGIGGAWPIDVGMRATPVPVFWNDDDLLDLVVGAYDGLIHVYVNCGCGTGGVPPAFYYSPLAGQPAQENGRDLQVPGLRSSPVVMDLDGDGKKDLLTGNTDGQILFYKNVGLDGLPMFSGYSLVSSNGAPIDLPGTPRSRPFVCDWNNDGSWDLLIGAGDGKIRLYRGRPGPGDLDGDGDLDADDFTFIARALDKPVPPEGSPADLNGDRVVDILDLRLFADLWLAVYGDADPKP